MGVKMKNLENLYIFIITKLEIYCEDKIMQLSLRKKNEFIKFSLKKEICIEYFHVKIICNMIVFSLTIFI